MANKGAVPEGSLLQNSVSLPELKTSSPFEISPRICRNQRVVSTIVLDRSALDNTTGG